MLAFGAEVMRSFDWQKRLVEAMAPSLVSKQKGAIKDDSYN